MTPFVGGKPKRGGHEGHEAFRGRCPSCAALGNDRTGNHLLYWDDPARGYLKLSAAGTCGCSEEAILAALGWTADDLRLAPREDAPRSAGRAANKPAAPPSPPSETLPHVPPDLPSRPSDHGKVWEYHDAKGRLALSKRKEYAWKQPRPATDGSPAVLARWGKEFPQWCPGDRKPRDVGGRILYNLPAVLAAVHSGATVYVNEGEKGCDAFPAGAVATCQNVGAGKGDDLSQKWTEHHTRLLRGARLVVVVADKDAVGEAYARHVAGQLVAADVPVRVVEAATWNGKDDAWDHFDAGLGLDALVPRLDLLPPPDLELFSFGEEFAPVRLEHIVQPYLPKGKCVLFDADGGVGKTTMALQWAAALSRGVHPLDANESLEGGPVKTLYLHKGEDGCDELETIYRANGGVPGMLVFVSERTAPTLRFDPEGLGKIKRAIRREGFGLVIVDALFYFLEGLVGTGYDAVDVMPVVQRMNDVARETGATFWNVRHTTKGSIGKAASELGMGSTAFRNSHRGQLVARKHPTNRGAVVVTDEKGSLLNPQGEFFMFRRVGHEVQYLLDQPNPFDSESPQEQLAARAAKLEQAKTFLRERITGEWAATAEVLREAEALGIGKRTVEKARALLGVQHRTVAVGTKNVTYLHLPPPFDGKEDPFANPF